VNEHTQTKYKGGTYMTVEEQVKKIIMEQLNVTEEECVPEAKFIDDLGADSLDLVELIMAMEDYFGLEISDDELAQISTIQDVIDYIASRQSA
jgi:acyl carrier protein